MASAVLIKRELRELRQHFGQPVGYAFRIKGIHVNRYNLGCSSRQCISSGGKQKTNNTVYPKLDKGRQENYNNVLQDNWSIREPFWKSLQGKREKQFPLRMPKIGYHKKGRKKMGSSFSCCPPPPTHTLHWWLVRFRVRIRMIACLANLPRPFFVLTGKRIGTSWLSV